MKGDFYHNAILAFVGEAITEYGSAKLTDIYGRKRITLITVILGIISFFLYIIMPKNFSSFLIMTSMIGFAEGFITIKILVNELFPTQIRGTVVSDCVLIQRLSPIVIKIFGLFMTKGMIDISFIIGGIIASSLTYYYLPETLGSKQNDFIAENENQSNNDNHINKIIDVNDKNENNIKEKFLEKY